MLRISILLLAIACVCVAAIEKKKIVCYYASWAVYRKGNGKMDISDIDPSLCTHLIYSFVGVSEDNGIKINDPWADLSDGGGLNGFNKFNRLKEKNPNAKTLVAIGGWNERSERFSAMASHDERRQQFVEKTVTFLKKYNFDGLDVDWEYPGHVGQGGAPADKQNFVKLLKDLRQRFDQEGLLLSAAVGASVETARAGYDIPEISKHLDFINLMAYDYSGTWSTTGTGLNSPLGEVKASVEFYLSEGAPREKLILGMPLYGRSFTLSNPQHTNVGAPFLKGGKPGPYSGEEDHLGYNEICEMSLNDSNWYIYADEETLYMVKDDQWVGYDDEKSIVEKADYVFDMGLGGAMVWSLESEDFRGTCGERNPLLKAINRVFGNAIATTATPQGPTDVKTSENPDSQFQEPEFETQLCNAEGYVRDPNDCSVFHICELNRANNRFIPNTFICPSGTLFDKVNNVCNWPNRVRCD